MRIGTTLHILGLLLMSFSLFMLLPGAVSLAVQDGAADAFFYSLAITFGAGFCLWLPFAGERRELRTRDGFLVTVAFYVALGLFGALPFLLEPSLKIGVADALFESASGITTTGATVLTGLDELAPSVLFYRQLLQWLGGMGILVLAVAVLPMLGVGGMQLFRAETPGPMKDSKLTPRIKQTALALWSIYLGLTLACALAYLLAGMSLFDAICHSFSTTAVGGFSTHDASLGHFDSLAVELVAIAFMLISSVNFALHFVAWRNRSLSHYLKDAEVRVFLASIVCVLLVCTLILSLNTHEAPASALRASAFQVVSIFSTTGFTTENFSQWPNALPFLLIFSAFVGACAGSTGGGMKVVRIMLIFKQGLRELHRLIHPQGVFPIKQNNRSVDGRVLEAVWGFFSVYVLVFTLLMVLLLLLGLDFTSAFSAVAACINNLGPGLGEVAANYGALPEVAKYVLCLAMLLGRLEIFTLLVLLAPMFWAR